MDWRHGITLKTTGLNARIIGVPARDEFAAAYDGGITENPNCSFERCTWTMATPKATRLRCLGAEAEMEMSRPDATHGTRLLDISATL